MSKKGVVMSAAFTAILLLSGCTPREPMPVHPVDQTGPSTKLGFIHHHRCKHHDCICCNHR